MACAATANVKIEPTSTQAVIRVTTDQPGACTFRISGDSAFSSSVHDTDTSLFTGANLDSRRGSLVDGAYRTFVAGRRDSEVALDGRMYSRALKANTTHWVGVTCGTDVEIVQTFQTQNPPLGQTSPEAAPFNTQGFGNYAWPSIDFTDQSKTYADPMTGIVLKRVTGPGWANAKDYQNNAFVSSVDINSAWTNVQNVLTWPGAANKLASYSGAAGDPLFAAIDFSAVADYGYGALTTSGWTPQVTVDDLLVRTFGFGTDASGANRTVLICLTLDSGNTCNTPEIPATLPSGSAQTGPTAPASGFPQPAWTSWASTLPFHGRDFGTVITTVITAGNTITNTGSLSSQYFSRAWKPGGKVLVNGTEIYTIASVPDSSTIVTVEPLASHSSAVSFKSLCAGVRIRKKTGTGTISLSAGYDFAVSGEFTMPLTGVRNLCSPLTVNVTVDANGNPASARQARLCALQSNYTHALFAFFSDNGEARLLSNFSSSAGFQYHSPDWQQYDGTGPDSTHYTESDVWDPQVATRFYSFIPFKSGNFGLVRMDYHGNFSSYKPFPATNGYSPGVPWPDDSLTATVVGGFPSQGKAVDQQAAAAGNSFFSASLVTNWSMAGLLPGGVAVWTAGICCSENPTFLIFQDVNTGNVTKVIDTISTYPMRFWGTHTTQILDGYFVVIANILGNKGISTSNFLGGPFILYPTAVQQNGQWNTNTAIDATYAENCPATIDPKWQALGATGQNCLMIRAKQPCSDYAAPGEAAKFPCPWDPSKSMVSTVAPGDRFWIDFPASPSGESMRIVSNPTDIGGGVAEFRVLRHSERYNNLGGSYGGTGDAHPNGWTAAMIPPEARTNAAVEIAPDGTVYAENYTLSATHSGIGTGQSVSNATSILAGVDPATNQPDPNAYGIRWDKPMATQAGKGPDYNLPANGRFGGVDNGGGAMESYISMQQNQAPVNEKRWFLDLHHLNPSTGVGEEYYSGIGALTSNLVQGTANVYRFTSYPGNHSDIKKFPPMAYAGPYLLSDVSGPSSQIADTSRWTFCYVYRAGECKPGSAVGEIYTSVPAMDTRGLGGGSGSCIAGWYAQTNPCVMIPYSSAGWAMQVDASKPAVDNNYWRKLTQGFSGMGRQYQFGNITPEPDGQWAFIQCYWCDGARNDIFGVHLPPFPSNDSGNRADFVPISVSLQGGFGTTARVKFGYAENGPVSSFFCTSRQETCVTDKAIAPFAYLQTEAMSPQPCSNGCTLSIPALSGRVLYYRVERLDHAGNVVSSEPPQVAAIQ